MNSRRISGFPQHRRYRPNCEHFLELDVRRLHREGLLRPNTTKLLRVASREGATSAVMRVQVDSTHPQLSYSWTPWGSDSPEPMDYLVEIEQTRCRFGGWRPWFRCPRCQSRRAVLYGVADDGRFGCRGCMWLVYASQDERKMCRLWRKQRRLEAKLADLGRPKGMHWSTFRHVCGQLNTVLARQDRLFCDGARALFRRKGWPWKDWGAPLKLNETITPKSV